MFYYLRILIFSQVILISGFAQRSDKYELTYFKTERNIIHVKAKIILEDSLLYMSQNSSKSKEFPKYVKNLKVSNMEGYPIKVKFQDSVSWILQKVSPNQIVTLEYELHVNHEQQEWPGGTDGIAYIRDFGVMTTGRSLFVMNGEKKGNIRVYVEIPEGAKISTPWQEIPTKINSFKVPDLENLQEAFLFAGTHEEFLINRDAFTLKFVLGGENLVRQKEKLVNTANELLDYYIKLMGGIPVPAPGNKLDQSLVIITENDNIDGEVIGNHISMFMDPAGDPESQMIGWFIFAHEFFHLWNGKSMRFEGTRSDWFKEGFSNYYTLKGLYEVGFISEDGYLAILNNLFFQRYINDPGLGVKTAVNSAEGFSKDQHWGLIYGGGLFAAIASDMEIRQQSANESSLDDLMRSLFEEYAGTNNYIDNIILKEQITRFGFKDFENFFNDHLAGTHAISLEPYLKYAGAHVVQENKYILITQVKEKSDIQKAIWAGFLGSLD